MNNKHTIQKKRKISRTRSRQTQENEKSNKRLKRIAQIRM